MRKFYNKCSIKYIERPHERYGFLFVCLLLSVWLLRKRMGMRGNTRLIKDIYGLSSFWFLVLSLLTEVNMGAMVQ